MEAQKTKFCSFGGYRRFCDAWWNDLAWYVIGLSWTNRWNIDDGKPWWTTLRWRSPGWVNDISTYWHRARYGWAPRDTWSLDRYLNRVLSGSLMHLADHTEGAPGGYGAPVAGEDTNFEQWDADLRRWAKAFSEDPSDVDIYDTPDYKRHRAEEKRRYAEIHKALREIEPWWDALWD